LKDTPTNILLSTENTMATTKFDDNDHEVSINESKATPGIEPLSYGQDMASNNHPPVCCSTSAEEFEVMYSTVEIPPPTMPLRLLEAMQTLASHALRKMRSIHSAVRVEVADMINLSYPLLHNTPNVSRGMGPGDETPIISTEINAVSKQSKCSNITKGITYNSSSTVNAKYSEDLEKALVVERKPSLSIEEPSIANAKSNKELETSAVERKLSSLNEENYTEGQIKKLFVCCQIPFQGNAGGYKDADSATYCFKKAALRELVLLLHDGDVDEVLNVKTYDDSDGHVSHMDLFDWEVMVDPSVRNFREENAILTPYCHFIGSSLRRTLRHSAVVQHLIASCGYWIWIWPWPYPPCHSLAHLLLWHRPFLLHPRLLEVIEWSVSSGFHQDMRGYFT
jgi:hypothetical protein